jgi:hypothetical protein
MSRLDATEGWRDALRAMREIGDTLFVVLYRNQARDDHSVSVHVTRIAAEQKAAEVRREGHQILAIQGPLPVQLEL